MSDDYEYFRNKRPDRVYLSRSLSTKQFLRAEDGTVVEFERPIRIVSKVIDGDETHQFIRHGKEIALRVTEGGRQEIKATFYQDTREVSRLQIQRYALDSGTPHNTHFTFSGTEISVLYNFLRNVAILPLKDENSAKLAKQTTSTFLPRATQAVDQLISRLAAVLQERCWSRLSTRPTLGSPMATKSSFRRTWRQSKRLKASTWWWM